MTDSSILGRDLSQQPSLLPPSPGAPSTTTTKETSPAGTTTTYQSVSTSSPVHVTGTSAGLAAAGVVIASAILAYFHIDTSPAVAAAEQMILTYFLGAWLHLPSDPTPAS
jgi:hypothetical protein